MIKSWLLRVSCYIDEAGSACPSLLPVLNVDVTPEATAVTYKLRGKRHEDERQKTLRMATGVYGNNLGAKWHC